MLAVVTSTCLFLALPLISASDGIACMEDCLTRDDPKWEAILRGFREAVYGSEDSRARRSVDRPLLDGHHMQKRDADLTNSSCGDLLVSLCFTSCKNNPMQAVAQQRMDIHFKYCNPSASQDVIDKFWSDWKGVSQDLKVFFTVCARMAYLRHEKNQTISHCSVNTRCVLNALDYVKQKYASTDVIILSASDTKLMNSVFYNRETPQTCPDLYEPYQP